MKWVSVDRLQLIEWKRTFYSSHNDTKHGSIGGGRHTANTLIPLRDSLNDVLYVYLALL